MRTFVDAVANFIPDELTLFLLVVFDREVVSTTPICSRLVVRPIEEFIHSAEKGNSKQFVFHFRVKRERKNSGNDFINERE